MRSEILTSLRFTAAQLVDFPASGVREIGKTLVRQLDAEIARPAPVIPAGNLNLTTVKIESLLKEIARRIREARQIPKACARCQSRPVRAKGLCMQCYQRERKRQSSIMSARVK